MLIFIDESGDLGFQFTKGSSQFFTLALMVFESGIHSAVCQQRILTLREGLHVPAHYEFHFHRDNHERRLAFLRTVQHCDFTVYSFTLNKERIWAESALQGKAAYRIVCQYTLENVRDGIKHLSLTEASLVIDSSGERRFKQELTTYLKREMNRGGIRGINRIKMSRPESDPLIQLADYVAGVTNRLYLGKDGAEQYEQLLARKRRSKRRWP